MNGFVYIPMAKSEGLLSVFAGKGNQDNFNFTQGDTVSAEIVKIKNSVATLRTPEEFTFSVPVKDIKGDEGDVLHFKVIKKDKSGLALRQIYPNQGGNYKTKTSERGSAAVADIVTGIKTFAEKQSDEAYKLEVKGEKQVKVAQDTKKAAVKQKQATAKLVAAAVSYVSENDVNLSKINFNDIEKVIDEIKPPTVSYPNYPEYPNRDSEPDNPPKDLEKNPDKDVERVQKLTTGGLTDEATAELIRSEKPISPINIYSVRYSAKDITPPEPKVWEDMEEQVSKRFENEGIEYTKANMDTAKLLINHDLPVSKENIDTVILLKNLETIPDDIYTAFVKEHENQGHDPVRMPLTPLLPYINLPDIDTERTLELVNLLPLISAEDTKLVIESGEPLNLEELIKVAKIRNRQTNYIPEREGYVVPEVETQREGYVIPEFERQAIPEHPQPIESENYVPRENPVYNREVIPPREGYVIPEVIPPREGYIIPEVIPPREGYIIPEVIPPREGYIIPEVIPPREGYVIPEFERQPIPERPQPVEQENNYPVYEREVITAQRQIAEIQLKLTVQAALRLANSGLKIETEPIADLVVHLRELETEKNASFLRIAGAEDNERNLSEMETVFRSVSEIRPVLNSLNSNIQPLILENKVEFTIGGAHKAATDRYEAAQTQPKARYGDSFAKVEAQFENLLERLEIPVTDENVRAAAILSRNNIDVTEVNITAVKEIDIKLNAVMDRLTPPAAAQMIKEGIQPLDMHVDDMLTYIRKYDEVHGYDNNDKLAQHIMEMDRENTLTQEERASMIAVYRMLNVIQKNGGAALGAVLKQDAPLTLQNLMDAAKIYDSSRHIYGAVDTKVDDNLGKLESIVKPPESIRGAIEKSLLTVYVNELKEVITKEFPPLVYNGTTMPERSAPQAVSREMPVTNSNEQVRELVSKVSYIAEELNPVISSTMIKEGLTPQKMNLEQVVDYVEAYKNNARPVTEETISNYIENIGNDTDLSNQGRQTLLDFHKAVNFIREQGLEILVNFPENNAELTLADIIENFAAPSNVAPQVQMSIPDLFIAPKERERGMPNLRQASVSNPEPEPLNITQDLKPVPITPEDRLSNNETGGRPANSYAPPSSYNEMLAENLTNKAAPDNILKWINEDSLNKPLEDLLNQQGLRDIEMSIQQAALAVRQFSDTSPAIIAMLQNSGLIPTPNTLRAARRMSDNDNALADALNDVLDELTETEGGRSIHESAPKANFLEEGAENRREMFKRLWLAVNDCVPTEKALDARDMMAVHYALNFEDGVMDMPVLINGRFTSLKVYTLNEDSVAAGNARTFLSLTTEGLGNVQSYFQMEDAGISLVFTADNPAARARLEANKDLLEGLIAEAGYEVSGLSFIYKTNEAVTKALPRGQEAAADPEKELYIPQELSEYEFTI